MSVTVCQPLCAVLFGALLGVGYIPGSGDGSQTPGYGNSGHEHSVVLQSRGRS
jgi:hypothetical protein